MISRRFNEWIQWQRLTYFFQKGSWPIAGGTAAVFDQDSFRFRDDDGSETTATFLQLANIDIAVGDRGTTDKGFDTNIRYRVLIQETAGGMGNNHRPQLQYDLNGANSWIDVNATSSTVRSSISGNFAEGDDTTQQIGAGTFISPNNGMDEDEGLAGEAMDMDFAGNDECEAEYSFQVRSADVNDLDTLDLRVVNAGAAYGAYTNIGRMDIQKVAADPFNSGHRLTQWELAPILNY